MLALKFVQFSTVIVIIILTGVGTISGPEAPTEGRAGTAINDQHPKCSLFTLSHQSREKAVEHKEQALKKTANETTGGQKGLLDMRCCIKYHFSLKGTEKDHCQPGP